MNKPKIRLSPGFAVFNCHLNKAAERADQEVIFMFGQEKFDKIIKPQRENGIMTILSDERRTAIAWVALCTAFVNENRVPEPEPEGNLNEELAG